MPGALRFTAMVAQRPGTTPWPGGRPSASAGVLGVVLAALLAACGTNLPSVGTGEGSAPPSLVAVATQSRADAADGLGRDEGRFSVRLRNEGPGPVGVVSLRLRWSATADRPPVVREELLPPGVAYALPVDHGRATCVPTPDRPRVEVGLSDGRTVVLPLGGADLLDRLVATHCALRSLQKQVGVAFELGRRSGRGLEGAVVLTVRPGVRARVVETRGSVLYDVTAVRSTDARHQLVTVTPVHCTGHALGEAKQPYAFTAFVSVDDAAPLAVPLSTSATQRAALLDLQRAVCQNGTASR